MGGLNRYGMWGGGCPPLIGESLWNHHATCGKKSKLFLLALVTTQKPSLEKCYFSYGTLVWLFGTELNPPSQIMDPPLGNYKYFPDSSCTYAVQSRSTSQGKQSDMFSATLKTI